MPSFDVVSEVDKHELTNALDQANREVGNRFDFKGSGAEFEYKDENILMTAEAEFQLQQMLDILNLKIAKRSIDVACLDPQDVEITGNKARQLILIRQGIDQTLAKKISRMIKDSKIKVQCTIQGDQLRVNGKKRDDLQAVMAMLKASDIDLPLQFSNFRD
ncbi:MAG: YajQ family cyclic di-GMP-binding protein [Gammaproteobacteria bacterium]|nr:YajQ family cyclic di-GMP-binding protein [Gammaproteobacteria bacterium]